MPTYPLGQPVLIPITVTDDSVPPVPVDVSPLPTLLLYRPDGAASPPPFTAEDEPGTGNYSVTLQADDLDIPGRWRFQPSAVGLNAGVDFDVFDVIDPATYPRLVSFADAAKVVKIAGTEDNLLLDQIISWASARILMEVQAYRAETTQRVNVFFGDPNFTLSATPVRSITAVTAADGTTVAPSTLTVTHPNAGLVSFARGALGGTYDVDYVAGTDEIPPGVDGACMALIVHWWGQLVARRSATYAPGGQAMIVDFSGLPNTVQNMLAVVSRPWGVA